MSIETQDIIQAYRKRPVVFALGACGLVLLIVIYLRFGLLDELQVVLQERQEERAKYAQNIKNSAQLQKQLEEAKVLNAAIKKQLINPSDTALNQKIFYQIESELGVKILDIQPLPTANSAKTASKSYFMPVGFKISFSGDYIKVMGFIRRLEERFTVGRISSITMSRALDATSGGSVQRLVSLNLQVLAINPDYSP